MFMTMQIEGSRCDSYLQIFHFFNIRHTNKSKTEEKLKKKLEKEKNKLIIFYWKCQHQDFECGTFGLLSVQVCMVEGTDM